MAAQGNAAPLQNETATRLSFYGPKIKSEADELSALGGMTRLVSRQSPSSPSLSSPTSQQSSPPAAPDSQVYPTPPHESSSLNTWQSYTHIQNLNVNINMSPNDYFSNNIPISPEVPQEEMSMLYQMPPHLQQQQQVHQQQHHHHRLSQGMSMDTTSPHSPSYYGNGYGQGYGNGYAVSHLGPRMRTPPTHDFQDSWLNFMAPYTSKP